MGQNFHSYDIFKWCVFKIQNKTCWRYKMLKVRPHVNSSESSRNHDAFRRRWPSCKSWYYLNPGVFRGSNWCKKGKIRVWWQRQLVVVVGVSTMYTASRLIYNKLLSYSDTNKSSNEHTVRGLDENPLSWRDTEGRSDLVSYLGFLCLDEQATPHILPELVQVLSDMHLQAELRAPETCENEFCDGEISILVYLNQAP